MCLAKLCFLQKNLQITRMFSFTDFIDVEWYIHFKNLAKARFEYKYFEDALYKDLNISLKK